MKHKFNIWVFLSALLSVLLVASEGLLVYRIWKLDVLPTLYFSVLAGLLTVAAVIVLLLLYPWKKVQKRKALAATVRTIAFILALVLIIGCFAGYAAATKLGNTFNTITNAPTVSAQVGVYVLANDPAQTLEEAADYTFGVTPSYDFKNTEETLAQMQTLFGKEPLTQDYDTVFAMITGLYLGNVKAIILNTAYTDLLEDAEGFTDFSSKTKLLREFTIETAADPQTVDPSHPNGAVSPDDPSAQVVDPLYQPFAVYLSGSDTRSSFLAPSRSDVNIIAVVNPATKQILLVNTPRDYFIPNSHSESGALDKLAHCGVWGIDCSQTTLSNYYGQPLKYYAQINFTGFETLIDAIGGITIYADEGDGVHLQAGANYMNGEQALSFARDRYSYADGDNARGRHQMQVISAVVDKLTSGSLITNYSQILDSLEGMFVTNIPNETISAYIKMQLSDMAHWDVFSFAVTGYGGYDQPYSMGGLYAWVMYPYQDTADHASDLMGRMLRGEKLTAADIPMP